MNVFFPEILDSLLSPLLNVQHRPRNQSFGEIEIEEGKYDLKKGVCVCEREIDHSPSSS